MRSQKLLYIFSLCLVYQVLGQDDRPPDPNNRFSYPGLPGPQFSNDPSVFSKNINITYGVDQSAPFRWKTNMSFYSVVMVQEGNPISAKYNVLIGCGPAYTDNIYWNGALGPINVANGTIVYLGVWNCTSGGEYIGTPVFFSHYFNLTAPVTAQASSTSNTAATIAQTPSTTPSLSTTMPSTSGNTTFDSSSSNAVAIGGGVGGGLGGALVILAAIFLYLWYRGSKRKEQMLESQVHGQAYINQSQVGEMRPAPHHPHAWLSRAENKPSNSSHVFPSELENSQLQPPAYLHPNPSELSAHH